MKISKVGNYIIIDTDAGVNVFNAHASATDYRLSGDNIIIYEKSGNLRFENASVTDLPSNFTDGNGLEIQGGVVAWLQENTGFNAASGGSGAELTPDEIAGIQNANGLSVTNPVATMGDLTTGLELGETATTAYRGDRGKIAYDHSQEVTGNPHNVNASDVGLGNVDDTSDLDKPISTATQNALDDKTDNTDFTDHTSNQLNPHNVTKAQVGLSNVNNTSDLDKPVSTAQAAANTVIQNDVDEKVYSKTTNEPLGSDKVFNMVSLTQAEYDAGTPNSDTFYIITDA